MQLGAQLEMLCTCSTLRCGTAEMVLLLAVASLGLAVASLVLAVLGCAVAVLAAGCAKSTSSKSGQS